MPSLGGRPVRQVCPEADRDAAFWWRSRTEADEAANATVYAVGLVLTRPDISLRLANGRRANKQHWHESEYANQVKVKLKRIKRVK